MLKREITPNILKQLQNQADRNTLIVEGARQVGKTTLVRSLLPSFKNVLEINLETSTEWRREIDATKDFQQFSELLAIRAGLADQPSTLLFIDEAQESAQLGNYVRSFKEIWKHSKVILSGSSMTRLFRDEQRVPVGRYSQYLLTPLTFHEFILAHNLEPLNDYLNTFATKPIACSQLLHQEFLKLLDLYMQIGGLPQVVENYRSGQDWRRLRKEIFLSQEEDFVRKTNISPSHYLAVALKTIANNLGYPSKLSQLELSHYEATKIIGLLERWKLIHTVEQKGSSPTSQFLPKRYMYDLGIAQDIREHPFPALSALKTLNPALRTPLGGLIENALLIGLIAHTSLFFNISGWKKDVGSSQEVDFVWREAQPIAIECKAALKISQRNLGGLLAYLNYSELERGYLVSLAPYKSFARNGKLIVNLPLYLAHPQTILDLDNS